MRRLAIAAAIVGILSSSTANADYYRNRGYHGGGGGYHQGGGGGWVAPLVGGMILGGAIYGLSQHSHAAPPPAYHIECRIVPAYDLYGSYVGDRRECFQVPNY